MPIETSARAGPIPCGPAKKASASQATSGGPTPKPISIVHMNMIAMAVARKCDGTVNWFEITMTLLHPDSAKIMTPIAATESVALGMSAARQAEMQPRVEAAIAEITSPSRRPLRVSASDSLLKNNVPSALAMTPVAP